MNSLVSRFLNWPEMLLCRCVIKTVVVILCELFLQMHLVVQWILTGNLETVNRGGVVCVCVEGGSSCGESVTSRHGHDNLGKF